MTTPLSAAEGTLEHVQWLRRLARSLVLDSAAAEDLSQDAWVAALETPPPAERPLRGWLAHALRNRARMRGRGERRRLERERAVARGEALPSTLDLLLRLSLQKELVAHVEALDEPYRTAILLRYFEGLKPAVIAERQGVPLATVKARLQRALERLRTRLDAQHGRESWVFALAPLAGAPSTAITVAAPSASAAVATGALLMSAKIPAVLMVVVAAAAAGFLWFEVRGESVGPERAADPSAPAVSQAAESAEKPRIEAPPAQADTRAAVAPTVAAKEEEPPTVAASSVQGRVIDVKSRPVSGIPVRFETRDGAELGQATTSADGSFDIESSGSGKLVASDERYTTVLAAISSAPATSPDFTVVVAPRGPLAGIVVDPDGRAVPEATVHLALPWDFRSRFNAILDRSQEESWRTTSDAAGAFELPNAPEVVGLVVVANKQSLGQRALVIQEPSLALRIVLGDSFHGVPRITGRVLDPLGVPVAGAHVALGFADDRSDSEGRFAIDVRHGEQQKSANTLRAVHPGFLPAELGKDPEKGWPETCELRFPGTTLTITGRVVVHDGAPLAGVEVRILDKTEFGAVRDNPEDPYSRKGFIEDLAGGIGEVDHVATDEHGRFTLGGLMPRDYSLDAFEPRNLALARVERVAAGTSSLEIRMPALERGPVAGRVLGLDGTPLVGVMVWPYLRKEDGTSEGEELFPVDLRLGESTTTGEQGAFHFDSLPTERLGLSVFGGDITIMSRWAVPESADRKALEVRLPRYCHFRVELTTQPELGERAEFFDAAGKRLPVVHAQGSFFGFRDGLEVTEGRSAVLSVSETARTLVLYKGKDEVLREPVSVTPGPVNVIEL